jgi:transposase-like protein
MSEASQPKATEKRKRKRFYSDNEKATILAAFAASGNNYSQTSKVFKVSINTIRDWVNKKCGVNEDIQTSVEQKKSEIADRLEDFVRLALDDVIGKIRDGRGGAPGSLMLAVGIALDKMQLLRGEATDRTELKLGEVLERIKARAASKGAGKDGGKAQAPDKPINPPGS